ncbi:unnamed protein product [Lactuca saligna]|uniref:Uncharacterized protein n=1 Tax=Lactuca saligna TaxID=75948 RepID=A0AA35YJ41_LACSI|nr:unnamed protein product [Lactuca saligna]
MKGLNNDACDNLMKRNPKTWCRAYFVTDKACEAIENGIYDSFNSAIVGAKEYKFKENCCWTKGTSKDEKMAQNMRTKITKFDERSPKGPSAATSGGRRGRGPMGVRGGRQSSAGTSGARGGRSLIDEMIYSPIENEVINMFDNLEEELHTVEMVKG